MKEGGLRRELDRFFNCGCALGSPENHDRLFDEAGVRFAAEHQVRKEFRALRAVGIRHGPEEPAAFAMRGLSPGLGEVPQALRELGGAAGRSGACEAQVVEEERDELLRMVEVD